MPDTWGMLFDRLDRIDNRLESLDGRLRAVENECSAIKSLQEAAKSRISKEVKAQNDADQSLQERVEKLELEAARDQGAKKGSWKLYLAIAAAAGTTSGGAIEAVGAILGS